MTLETLWAARRVLEMWLENAAPEEDTAPEKKALTEIVKAMEGTP